MLSPEKIERINELARKKKENGLSKAEKLKEIQKKKGLHNRNDNF